MINPRARPCDEQVIRSSRGTVDSTTRERRWVLAEAILASVIAYIDESVVNVALPAIAKDLATSLAVIQWVTIRCRRSLEELPILQRLAEIAFAKSKGGSWR